MQKSILSTINFYQPSIYLFGKIGGVKLATIAIILVNFKEFFGIGRTVFERHS